MKERDLQEAVQLYKNRRYEAALAALLECGIDPDDNPEIAYYLGLCYTKLEKYDDALLYLEQVVTNHTNILLIYQSRMILSYIYCITGRYRLAEFEVKQLLEQGFESPQVYSTFGYIHYMLDRVEESLSSLEKALKLDPDNANALNSLGYIMAEEGREPRRAVSYCLAAVKRNPNNYAYLDSLGWAYFKAGNYPEAREYLRKAMDLARGNKVIAGHMKNLMDAKNA